MTDQSPPSPPIETLAQARARIAELEQKLEEAIDLLVKRDDQIDAARRRIRQMEANLTARTEE